MTVLTVNTNNGSPFDANQLAALSATVDGILVTPQDGRYDETRRLWNSMIDKRPQLILQCLSDADVIKGLQFAQANQLALAVRGGGHNVAGSASVDGGLVIDLSLMRGVEVDAAKRIARVQAGALLGDIDQATQAYGLATSTGNVSATGIAGLTLNGGLGWLRRKYGMAVDSLLAVDIVTAAGELLRASATENTDLFWGVRGGGGNFGIVTAFEFQLYPVGPEVAFLTTMYPLSLARPVLKVWRDWTLTAPEEASADFLFWSVPSPSPFPEELQGQPVVIVAGVYAGDAAEGLKVFQPLRELGDALIDMTGPMPYLAVQSMFDPFFPDNLRHYWKSLYLETLTDEAIEGLLARALDRPSPQTLIPLRHIGGAISRVADEATAVAHRSANYLLSFDATWADPAADERIIAWVRDFWASMLPFSDGGIYLNFGGLNDEGQATVQAAYGANYQRLVALKNKYDPHNVFRLNHNVKPE